MSLLFFLVLLLLCVLTLSFFLDLFLLYLSVKPRLEVIKLSNEGRNHQVVAKHRRKARTYRRQRRKETTQEGNNVKQVVDLALVLFVDYVLREFIFREQIVLR